MASGSHRKMSLAWLNNSEVDGRLKPTHRNTQKLQDTPRSMSVVWVGSPICVSRVGEGNTHQGIWGPPKFTAVKAARGVRP